MRILTFLLRIVVFHGRFKNGCVKRTAVFKGARVIRTPSQRNSNGKEARPVLRLASSS
jgi:hypothetical protein